MSKSKYNKRLKKQKEEKKKTLKAKRICMWLVLVFEVILILAQWCVGDLQRMQKAECTETADAVVTDIENVTGGNHHIKTWLTIAVDKDSDFSIDVIKSTSSNYEKGQRIRIFYDPHDHSDYYIKGELKYLTHTRIVLIVIAVLWVIVCVCVIRSVLNEKKKQKSFDWRKE